MTDEDPYAERKKLSFAQAEGVETIPGPLALRELSQELRSRLWMIVHESLRSSRKVPVNGKFYAVTGMWADILKRKHVYVDHAMADEFSVEYLHQERALKHVFKEAGYSKVFDLMQWLLRQPEQVFRPAQVRAALVQCRAAYRLLDDDRTIVPISSAHDAKVVNTALADLALAEFNGARAHLQASARHLTAGESADSIRESMHAVESVARVLSDSKSLSGALQKLKKSQGHPSSIGKGVQSNLWFHIR